MRARRRPGLLLALLPAMALLAGAAGEPAPPAAPPAAGDVIAQRGPVRLTVGELRALIDQADPAVRAQLATDPAALAAFVRERLLQVALAAEARAKAWDQRPDVAQRMNEARDAALVQSYLAALSQPDAGFPAEADIAAAYEANKARFLVPKQYHLAQIAILVPPGASHDAEEDARRRAQDVRAQAVRPRADFADLARKYSQERGGADHGGDIGWVREDRLVSGVKEAVTALAEGAVSDVVRGPSGWHVIKVLGTRPPSTAPLADVREQIVLALRQARQQQSARAYVDEMLKREPIQLNEIDLPHVVVPR
jgi:peptidylprolyl isomerase